MTNTKLAKRSFLVSLMALILCFSMLMGTTFAWFTDSVTSENNIIKSGSLKVAMDYADKYEGDTTAWTDASTGAIFDYQYWEPGYSEVKFIRITNKGDLALQFKLDIIPAVAAVAGEINLADVIDVYSVIADNAAELGALASLNLDSKDSWATVASAGTLTSLMGDVDGAAYGYLLPASGVGAVNAEDLGLTDAEFAALPQGEIIVALKLTMKETAGNEYQNLEVGKGFSVRLLATQFEAEKDAFDNMYDQDSEYVNKDVNGFAEVSNTTELLAALEQGSNVKLTADIALDSPLVFSAPASTFAMRSAPAPIILDLNGNEIVGNMHKSVGSVIKNEGNLIIKDGTISSTADNGGSALLNNGTVVLEGVTLNGAPNAGDGWPSYTVNNTGVLTATDTTFTSYHGAVATYGAGAVATLNDCVIDMAGIPGFTNHGMYTYDSGMIVVNGGTYANKAADQNATGGSVINGNVVVKSGTFSGRIENYYGTPSLAGGTYSVDPAKFVANGYTAEANSDGTWTVGGTKASSSGEVSSAIANGEVVELTDDITYNTAINNDATIDLAGNTFEATNTINLGNNADLTMTGGNYEVNSTYGHVDVRPSTAEGSVVTFEDVDFSFNKLGPTYGPSTNRLGSVVEVCATAADANTTILFKNCTFDNAQVLFEGLSGTVGTFNATFENCTFNALTSSAPIYVQNYVTGTLTVKGCTFNLTCTSSSASAISISPSSSTAVTLIAENNTFNAVAATPYTYDATAGETEVYNVKVNGTPANIPFVSIGGTTSTATVTGTVATGIAAQ